MAFKCVLLIYYKNSRGRNYRRQVRYYVASMCSLFGFCSKKDLKNKAGWGWLPSPNQMKIPINSFHHSIQVLGSYLYIYHVPLVSDHGKCLFLGSNAYFGWVSDSAVPCLVACTSLVSFLFKQRIWEPLFVSYDWVVSNFQAHFFCWEGILFCDLFFLFPTSVCLFFAYIWLLCN